MDTEPTIHKLLLVDDDANIRTLALMGLEGLTDWHVEQADSGQAALELASTNVPDVILLDMMMPSMDGIATYARLQKIEALRHVPVIFITAKVQSTEVEKYLELGVAGVITKPFDPMQLPEQIKSLVYNQAVRCHDTAHTAPTANN